MEIERIVYVRCIDDSPYREVGRIENLLFKNEDEAISCLYAGQTYRIEGYTLYAQIFPDFCVYQSFLRR
jgi:hypothetical protein